MCVDKNIRMRQENIRFPNVSTSLAYNSNKIVRKFANKEKKDFLLFVACLLTDRREGKVLLIVFVVDFSLFYFGNVYYI